MLRTVGVKGELRRIYRMVRKMREADQDVIVSDVLDELMVLLRYVLKYKGEALGYPFELEDVCFMRNVWRLKNQCMIW